MQQENLILLHENATNIICNTIFGNSPDSVYFLLGAELEFYLDCQEEIEDLSHPLVLNLFQRIKTLGYKNNLLVEQIEAEDGFNQFEIQTVPTENPLDLANFIESLQNDPFCLENGLNLAAKPVAEEPPSGMHFHLSLYDCNDVNLFGPICASASEYQPPLYCAIAGLLVHTGRFMPIYSPTDNCYKRYKPPSKGQIFKHNPTNCSWGINNRTCAVRIPRSVTAAPWETRIEYRVCSPKADPHGAIGAMIYSVAEGIAKGRTPPEPIFGDSYEPMYFNNAPRFPISLAESRSLSRGCFGLQEMCQDLAAMKPMRPSQVYSKLDSNFA